MKRPNFWSGAQLNDEGKHRLWWHGVILAFSNGRMTWKCPRWIKVVCKKPPSVVFSFSVLKPCENKFEGRIDMLNVFRGWVHVRFHSLCKEENFFQVKCWSVVQGHLGVCEKRETSMYVFISLVQLVKFILLLWLKWAFYNSNVMEGLRKELVEQLLWSDSVSLSTPWSDINAYCSGTHFTTLQLHHSP